MSAAHHRRPPTIFVRSHRAATAPPAVPVAQSRRGRPAPLAATLTLTLTLTVALAAAAALTMVGWPPGAVWPGTGRAEGRPVAASPVADRPPAAWSAAPLIAQPLDPSRFLFTALFSPAIDEEAEPWRWTDPRPRLQCGPGTAIFIDGRPLEATAEVPLRPFVLHWQASACRPFGSSGARLDGTITYQVVREDGGISAIVLEADARLQSAATTRAISREATGTPLALESNDGTGLALLGAADGPLDTLPAWPINSPADRLRR